MNLRWLAPLRATLASLVALLAFGTGVTLLDGNARWAPAWAGIGLPYAVAAWGLARRRPWARPLALGAALYGAVLFVEPHFVVPGDTSFFTLGASLALALAASLFARAESEVGALPKRAWASLLFAGAALPGAFCVGLAQHGIPLLAVALVTAASLVGAGAVGLARGKTWGLFASMAGAAGMAALVPVAPELGWLDAPHRFLPQYNPLMLWLLGAAAAALSGIAVLPWAGPVWRFLRGAKATGEGTGVRVAAEGVEVATDDERAADEPARHHDEPARARRSARGDAGS